ARHQVDGGGDRSTRALTVAWLLHRNPLMRLPASSPPGVKGAHTHRRGGHHRRDEHLHRGTNLVATDEPAPERPDMRFEVECIVNRSLKRTLAHSVCG